MHYFQWCFTIFSTVFGGAALALAICQQDAVGRSCYARVLPGRFLYVDAYIKIRICPTFALFESHAVQMPSLRSVLLGADP